MAIKVKVTSFNLNYYTLLPPLSLILHSALDILWVKSNWHIATFLCIKNCEVPNLLKRFAWAFISILGISSLIYWNQVIYQQQTNTFPGQCLTTVVWNTSVKMPCFASASNLKDIWFTLPRQLFFWANISPKNWVRKLKYSSITSFCELSVWLCYKQQNRWYPVKDLSISNSRDSHSTKKNTLCSFILFTRAKILVNGYSPLLCGRKAQIQT